jgi:hypothetical protein
MSWTKKDRKQFRETISREIQNKLEALRKCGGVPDGFEDDEPASLPKIAVILMAEEVGLSDRAKRELKNLRRMV